MFAVSQTNNDVGRKNALNPSENAFNPNTFFTQPFNIPPRFRWHDGERWKGSVVFSLIQAKDSIIAAIFCIPKANSRSIYVDPKQISFHFDIQHQSSLCRKCCKVKNYLANMHWCAGEKLCNQMLALTFCLKYCWHCTWILWRPIY